MKQMENAQIKECSLQVLKALRSVCQANGLRYSLTGGSLIGAVRHQGFIPWDDDIDIMMPRPDYDRLVQVVGKGDYGFDLHCVELEGEAYPYPFAKACCRGTRVVEQAAREDSVPLGVFVDIFPVDGAGNRYGFSRFRVMCFQFLHGLKIAANWTRFQRSKLRKWYYEPFRYFCYLLSRVLGQKRLNHQLDRFLRAKSYAKSAYAGRLVGDYGSREVMPKGIFETYIPVTFEGEEFSAIADYDTFLSRLFGDYMQLPPKEKQVSHHDFRAYWVE